MSSLITTLIDKTDTFEIVRDQIAAILVNEVAAQKALASAAAKDPNLWDLRVFLERSNPWAEWLEDSETEVEPEVKAPIVNISFETLTAEKPRSNTVARQQVVGTFNLDCYGWGASEATETGHLPGDQDAAFEAARAARLVRNILMSAHYINLGLRGTVADRWISNITAFQPALDERTVQNVVACRVTLLAEFNEFSPQHELIELESILATVCRDPSGEVLLQAEYDFTDS